MDGFAKAPFWLDDYGDRVPSPVHGEWHVCDTASACRYGTLALSMTFLFTVYSILHNIVEHNFVLYFVKFHSTRLH